MMLTGLADIARTAGLTVIEVAGWKTRGHGEQTDVRTITCHHTADGGATGNAPSLGTVLHGRSDLPGPLAHYLLAKDGTVYVVAAGLCWHAGVSLKTDYENSHAVGIEAEADGVPGFKGDWPEVQMIAYARLCRALQEHFHLGNADVRGHKETCSPPGRKSDPDFSMPAFRSRVAATNLEDDVPLTTDDLNKIKALEAAQGTATTTAIVARVAADVDPQLAQLRTQLAALATQSTAVAGQVANLAAAVQALAAAAPTAAREAVAAEVAKIHVAVSVDQ